jgi:hypothetical protein
MGDKGIPSIAGSRYSDPGVLSTVAGSYPV